MEVNSQLRMASLSIAIGSMFSGKTTWLLEKYHIQTNRGKKCYPINYIEGYKVFRNRNGYTRRQKYPLLSM